jgi:phosphoglycerate dehydrogenase-like enzyme
MAEVRAILASDNVWRSHGERIVAVAPDAEHVVYEGTEPLPADVLAGVDVAFFSSDVWPERTRGIALSIMNTPSLRWLHSFSAGVDSPFFVQQMERGVVLTNSSGATASPIAQTAILYMLALSRDLRAWMRSQDRAEWSMHPIEELDGARLAVIGMGPIGTQIARLGAALGMSVEAVRRTPTGDEPCPTFPFSALPDVLGRADWVAVALPLADETRHLFDAGAFMRMKKGARFINVGRGELVDEPALVEALRSGHLAGAGLDVFEVEPLPGDSPLWAMDNVIVTPHNSGSSPRSAERAIDIFVENLGHWVRDEPLRNAVGP